MLKQIINTIKSMIYSLLTLVKDPIRDYKMQIQVKKEQFERAYKAVADSKAQVVQMKKEWLNTEKTLERTEQDLRNLDPLLRDEALLKAKEIATLRHRLVILEKTINDAEVAISRAEKQLKDIIFSVQDMETKIKTYELQKEISIGRRNIKNALKNIAFDNTEEDIEKNIKLEEYKLDAEDDLDEKLELNNGKVNTSVEAENILKEFGI